jgi:uncharacterized protein
MKGIAMALLKWTLLFAGICALIQFALTALVIIRRAQTDIDLLDGGDVPLLRRIRAHGNFAETAPINLLLFAALEISKLEAVWLITLGITLITGRLLHAMSLLTNNAPLTRRGGMVLTLAVMSIQGALCITLFFNQTT